MQKISNSAEKFALFPLDSWQDLVVSVELLLIAATDARLAKEILSS